MLELHQWKGNERRMNRLGIFLAFFALILSGLVPQGYMVAKAENGSLTVRICSGTADSSRKISSDNPEHQTYELLFGNGADEDEDDDSDRSPCPMGTAPAAQMPDDIFLADFLMESVAPFTGILSLLAGIYPTGLPPSTGPPRS